MTTATQQRQTDHKEQAMLRQLVVFQLGNEGFCVDINKVREINRLVKITKIPQSPEFVEGVINLRGRIIPVIDMRLRFGFEADSGDLQENRIMIIETGGALVGFLVDAVREVLRSPANSIAPTQALIASDIDRKYIGGVATLEDRLLIVLDSDLIFARKELGSLEAIQDGVPN